MRISAYICDGCGKQDDKKAMKPLVFSKSSGYYAKTITSHYCDACRERLIPLLTSRVTDWLGWTKPAPKPRVGVKK